MKFLKAFLTITIILLIVFFLGGFFLPQKYQIEAHITINKPDSLVFGNVADLNAYAQWNPWSIKDSTAQKEAINLPGIIGSTFYWKGDKIGEGKLEITHLILNKHLEESLTFIEPWESKAENTFHFEPIKGGTKVTWSMNGQNKNTFQRWMIAFFKGSIEDDYQEGLVRLKKYCEEN